MKIDWKKKISLPKLSRPSLGAPDLHAPKFLSDLYADLRDRHLLPLVALLVVAIIAAPILLSGKGGKEEPAAIAPASVEGETKDAGLTVVAAENGLRDYKRRLAHRAALNPFRRPPEPESAGGGSTGESTSSAAGSGAEGESGSTSSSGESVVKTTVGGVTTETIGSPTSQGPVEQPHRKHHKSSQTESIGGEATEASESTEPTPSAAAETAAVQGEVVGYTIDAEAGFVPTTSEKTGIAPMTKLPNKKHPLVLYMGLSKDHKRALFLMTSNVTAYYGGHCALDKQACQLVEVQPGKGVTFAAGYGETRYKLHLKKIVPVFHFSK
jgi:hypothetical protein